MINKIIRDINSKKIYFLGEKMGVSTYNTHTMLLLKSEKIILISQEYWLYLQLY